MAWDWMRMYKVKRVQEVEGGDFHAVVHGGIIKLGEGDLEVACMKDEMGEDVVESQTDRKLNRHSRVLGEV